MENKKGKVALNDDLLDKVSGGGGDRYVNPGEPLFCCDNPSFERIGESGPFDVYFCSNCQTTSYLRVRD